MKLNRLMDEDDWFNLTKWLGILGLLFLIGKNLIG